MDASPTTNYTSMNFSQNASMNYDGSSPLPLANGEEKKRRRRRKSVASRRQAEAEAAAAAAIALAESKKEPAWRVKMRETMYPWLASSASLGLLELGAWEYFLLIVYLLNMIQLMMCTGQEITERTTYGIALKGFEMVFNVIYIIEIVLMLVATGVMSILSPPRMLDAVLVLANFIILILYLNDVASDDTGFSLLGIRCCLRLLRPVLRTTTFPSVRVFVVSVTTSMLQLGDVIGLYILFMLWFGVAGVSQFRGTTYFQCMNEFYIVALLPVSTVDPSNVNGAPILTPLWFPMPNEYRGNSSSLPSNMTTTTAPASSGLNYNPTTLLPHCDRNYSSTFLSFPDATVDGHVTLPVDVMCIVDNKYTYTQVGEAVMSFMRSFIAVYPPEGAGQYMCGSEYLAEGGLLGDLAAVLLDNTDDGNSTTPANNTINDTTTTATVDTTTTTIADANGTTAMVINISATTYITTAQQATTAIPTMITEPAPTPTPTPAPVTWSPAIPPQQLYEVIVRTFKTGGEGTDRAACSPLQTCNPDYSQNLAGFICPFGYTCGDYDTPVFDNMFGFNNVLQSLLTLFVISTYDEWQTIMYVSVGGTTYWSEAFFVLFIIVGTFMLVNLTDVVLSIEYDKSKAEERRRINALTGGGGKALDLTAFSFTEVVRRAMAFEKQSALLAKARAETLSLKQQRAAFLERVQKAYSERQQQELEDAQRAANDERQERQRRKSMTANRGGGGGNASGVGTTVIDMGSPTSSPHGLIAIDSMNVELQPIAPDPSSPINGVGVMKSHLTSLSGTMNSFENAVPLANPDDIYSYENFMTEDDTEEDWNRIVFQIAELRFQHAFAAAEAEGNEKKMRLLRMRFYVRFYVVEARWFVFLTSCVTLANICLLATDYYGITESHATSIWILNGAFSAFYTLELVTRMLARPVASFFTSVTSYVDMFVVVMSWVDILPFANERDSTNRAFRIVRTARTFRFVKMFPKVYEWFKFILQAIAASPMVMLILLQLMFIFSAFSMQAFGGKFCGLDEEAMESDITVQYYDEFLQQEMVLHKHQPTYVCEGLPKANFEHFGYALLTSFQVLTNDNWTDVLINSMVQMNVAVALVYVLYLFVGNHIILSLLVAILLSAGESGGEDESLEDLLKEDQQQRLLKEMEEKAAKDAEEMVTAKKSNDDDEDSEMESVASDDEDDEGTRKKKAHRSKYVVLKSGRVRKVSQTGQLVDRFFAFVEDSRWYTKRLIESVAYKVTMSLIILLGSVVLAMYEPLRAPDMPSAQTLNTLTIVTTCFYVAELLLCLHTYGFIKRPTSYLRRDVFNVIDFIVLIINIVTLIGHYTSQTQALLAIGGIAALRPLRLARESKGVRLVIGALFKAIPQTKNILWCTFGFFLIFAILGVQIFSGRQRVCVTKEAEIVSQLSLAECDIIGGKWMNTGANFDDVGSALIALFQMATMEGWSQVMYSLNDIVGVHEGMQRDANLWAILYCVPFTAFTGLFLSNVIAATIIDAYNSQKRKAAFQKSVYVTREQAAWLTTNQRIARFLPVNSGAISQSTERSLKKAVRKAQLKAEGKSSRGGGGGDGTTVGNNSMANASFFSRSGGGGAMPSDGSISPSSPDASKTPARRRGGGGDDGGGSSSLERPLLSPGDSPSPGRDGDGWDSPTGDGEGEEGEEWEEYSGSDEDDSSDEEADAARRRRKVLRGRFEQTSNKLRDEVRKVVRKGFFAKFGIFVVLCNFIALCAQHYPENSSIQDPLDALFITFAAWYAFEAVVKIIGEGWRLYFKSQWSRLELVIAILAIVAVSTSSGANNSSPFAIIVAMAVLRLGRLTRGKMKIEALIGKLGLAALGLLNVFAVVLIVMFVFGVVGMRIFGRVKYEPFGAGSGINTYSNFMTFHSSLMFMFQLMTAENWNNLMYATTVKEPFCSSDLGNCGVQDAVAYIYFFCACFVLIFFLRNLIVAVILDSFATAASTRALRKQDAEVFYRNWRRFDPEESLFIAPYDIIHFIRMIPRDSPLSLYSKGNKGRVRNELTFLTALKLLNIRDKVPMCRVVDTLCMTAFRVPPPDKHSFTNDQYADVLKESLMGEAMKFTTMGVMNVTDVVGKGIMGVGQAALGGLKVAVGPTYNVSASSYRFNNKSMTNQSMVLRQREGSPLAGGDSGGSNNAGSPLQITDGGNNGTNNTASANNRSANNSMVGGENGSPNGFSGNASFANRGNGSFGGGVGGGAGGGIFTGYVPLNGVALPVELHPQLALIGGEEKELIYKQTAALILINVVFTRLREKVKKMVLQTRVEREVRERISQQLGIQIQPTRNLLRTESTVGQGTLAPSAGGGGGGGGGSGSKSPSASPLHGPASPTRNGGSGGGGSYAITSGGSNMAAASALGYSFSPAALAEFYSNPSAELMLKEVDVTNNYIAPATMERLRGDHLLISPPSAMMTMMRRTLSDATFPPTPPSPIVSSVLHVLNIPTQHYAASFDEVVDMFVAWADARNLPTPLLIAADGSSSNTAAGNGGGAKGGQNSSGGSRSATPAMGPSSSSSSRGGRGGVGGGGAAFGNNNVNITLPLWRFVAIALNAMAQNVIAALEQFILEEEAKLRSAAPMPMSLKTASMVSDGADVIADGGENPSASTTTKRKKSSAKSSAAAAETLQKQQNPRRSSTPLPPHPILDRLRPILVALKRAFPPRIVTTELDICLQTLDQHNRLVRSMSDRRARQLRAEAMMVETGTKFGERMVAKHKKFLATLLGQLSSGLEASGVAAEDWLCAARPPTRRTRKLLMGPQQQQQLDAKRKKRDGRKKKKKRSKRGEDDAGNSSSDDAEDGIVSPPPPDADEDEEAAYADDVDGSERVSFSNFNVLLDPTSNPQLNAHDWFTARLMLDLIDLLEEAYYVSGGPVNANEYSAMMGRSGVYSSSPSSPRSPMPRSNSSGNMLAVDGGVPPPPIEVLMQQQQQQMGGRSSALVDRCSFMDLPLLASLVGEGAEDEEEEGPSDEQQKRGGEHGGNGAGWKEKVQRVRAVRAATSSSVTLSTTNATNDSGDAAASSPTVARRQKIPLDALLDTIVHRVLTSVPPPLPPPPPPMPHTDDDPTARKKEKKSKRDRSNSDAASSATVALPPIPSSSAVMDAAAALPTVPLLESLLSTARAHVLDEAANAQTMASALFESSHKHFGGGVVSGNNDDDGDDTTNNKSNTSTNVGDPKKKKAAGTDLSLTGAPPQSNATPPSANTVSPSQLRLQTIVDALTEGLENAYAKSGARRAMGHAVSSTSGPLGLAGAAAAAAAAAPSSSSASAPPSSLPRAAVAVAGAEVEAIFRGIPLWRKQLKTYLEHLHVLDAVSMETAATLAEAEIEREAERVRYVQASRAQQALLLAATNAATASTSGAGGNTNANNANASSAASSRPKSPQRSTPPKSPTMKGERGGGATPSVALFLPPPPSTTLPSAMLASTVLSPTATRGGEAFAQDGSAAAAGEGTTAAVAPSYQRIGPFPFADRLSKSILSLRQARRACELTMRRAERHMGAVLHLFKRQTLRWEAAHTSLRSSQSSALVAIAKDGAMAMSRTIYSHRGALITDQIHLKECKDVLREVATACLAPNNNSSSGSGSSAPIVASSSAGIHSGGSGSGLLRAASMGGADEQHHSHHLDSHRPPPLSLGGGAETREPPTGADALDGTATFSPREGAADTNSSHGRVGWGGSRSRSATTAIPQQPPTAHHQQPQPIILSALPTAAHQGVFMGIIGILLAQEIRREEEEEAAKKRKGSKAKKSAAAVADADAEDVVAIRALTVSPTWVDMENDNKGNSNDGGQDNDAEEEGGDDPLTLLDYGGLLSTSSSSLLYAATDGTTDSTRQPPMLPALLSVGSDNTAANNNAHTALHLSPVGRLLDAIYSYAMAGDNNSASTGISSVNGRAPNATTAISMAHATRNYRRFLISELVAASPSPLPPAAADVSTMSSLSVGFASSPLRSTSSSKATALPLTSRTVGEKLLALPANPAAFASHLRHLRVMAGILQSNYNNNTNSTNSGTSATESGGGDPLLPSTASLSSSVLGPSNKALGAVGVAIWNLVDGVKPTHLATSWQLHPYQEQMQQQYSGAAHQLSPALLQMNNSLLVSGGGGGGGSADDSVRFEIPMLSVPPPPPEGTPPLQPSASAPSAFAYVPLQPAATVSGLPPPRPPQQLESPRGRRVTISEDRNNVFDEYSQTANATVDGGGAGGSVKAAHRSASGDMLPLRSSLRSSSVGSSSNGVGGSSPHAPPPTTTTALPITAGAAADEDLIHPADINDGSRRSSSQERASSLIASSALLLQQAAARRNLSAAADALIAPFSGVGGGGGAPNGLGRRSNSVPSAATTAMAAAASPTIHATSIVTPTPRTPLGRAVALNVFSPQQGGAAPNTVPTPSVPPAENGGGGSPAYGSPTYTTARRAPRNTPLALLSLSSSSASASHFAASPLLAARIQSKLSLSPPRASSVAATAAAVPVNGGLADGPSSPAPRTAAVGVVVESAFTPPRLLPQTLGAMANSSNAEAASTTTTTNANTVGMIAGGGVIGTDSSPTRVGHPRAEAASSPTAAAMASPMPSTASITSSTSRYERRPSSTASPRGRVHMTSSLLSASSPSGFTSNLLSRGGDGGVGGGGVAPTASSSNMAFLSPSPSSKAGVGGGTPLLSTTASDLNTTAMFLAGAAGAGAGGEGTNNASTTAAAPPTSISSSSTTAKEYLLKQLKSAEGVPVRHQPMRGYKGALPSSGDSAAAHDRAFIAKYPFPRSQVVMYPMTAKLGVHILEERGGGGDGDVGVALCFYKRTDLKTPVVTVPLGHGSLWIGEGGGGVGGDSSTAAHTAECRCYTTLSGGASASTVLGASIVLIVKGEGHIICAPDAATAEALVALMRELGAE